MVEASVSLERLGSHFLLGRPSAQSARRLRALREASPVPGHPTGWAIPAVPAGARDLRRLLASVPDLTLDARAAALLEAVEGLPSSATAVVHPCEHRPGTLGALIVAEGHVDLGAELGTLPGRRYDPSFDRWWLPLGEDGPTVLAALLERHPWLAARPDIPLPDGPLPQARPVSRREIHRPDGHLPQARPVAPPKIPLPEEHPPQGALTPDAVAGLGHRCSTDVQVNHFGESRLRLCRRCHPDLEDELRETGGAVGRTYDSWWVTVDGASERSLRALVSAQPELAADAQLADALQRAAQTAREAEAVERASAGASSSLSVPALGGELHPFQAAGVAYALQARRTFIADEPGLGKTVQALAFLEAADAFPALVVCPASLRLNWLREAARWLPARAAAPAPSEEAADIRVASYDVLHRLVEPLTETPPRAVVLDESHYCKTPTARRTQAALAIVEALAPEAPVLLLTGTPVVNRPEELAPQLRLLGRLEAFGGQGQFNRVYARGRELDVLHRRLRRTCFVRRRKADVLKQLPAKQRVVVPLALASRGEYERVARDVAGWMRENAEADEAFVRSIEHLAPRERKEAIGARGREASQRARRATGLVRLGQLCQAAARGKLDAAQEWISGFLASDEKLVVYCRHREIAEA
ncbi:MAG TPA: SNF2-related protein, partial [Solirubrobacteraceae bacterium]